MKLKLILFALFLAIGFFSCKEEEMSCYDPKMEQDHPGICTEDCPGVCGCDGETYCNECIANSQGIEVVSNQPCK